MARMWVLFALVILFSLSFIGARELSINSLEVCKENCKNSYKDDLLICKEKYEECKGFCSDIVCRRGCLKEKTICVRDATSDYKLCKEECKAESMPKCMNGTYKYGETFEDGCDICECGTRGKVSCKREAFCNKNVSVSKKDCELGNGLYQALCNGPYFGIYCSQQEFCICNGNNNYGCPEGYECFSDFISPNKRKTLKGWKTLLGKPLGEIGVCVKSTTEN